MISVYFSLFMIFHGFLGIFKAVRRFDSFGSENGIYVSLLPCHYSVVPCLPSLEKAVLPTYLKFKNRSRLFQPQSL